MGSRYRRRGGTESLLETIVLIIPGVKSSEAGAGSQDHSKKDSERILATEITLAAL